MASAPRPLVALLFVAAVLLLAIAGSAKQIEYQTLVLAPLSKPPPLVRSTDADDLSWNFDSSEEEIPVAAESSASLQLTLHHRDSLHYAAANSTPESLFRLRLDRDAARVSSLGVLAAAAAAGGGEEEGSRSFSSSVVSGLAQGSGEYFTRIGIGTPPAPAYMVLDTGSDVVWIQCSPCRKCYSQSDPVFDPRLSRSYAAVPCGTLLCRSLDVSGCDARRRSCLYQVAYGDGSINEFHADFSAIFASIRHDLSSINSSLDRSITHLKNHPSGSYVLDSGMNTPCSSVHSIGTDVHRSMTEEIRIDTSSSFLSDSFHTHKPTISPKESTLHTQEVLHCLPQFDGSTDPTEWLAKANLYFTFHRTPVGHKVSTASSHFEGKALSWFWNFSARKDTLSWEELANGLETKFGLTIQQPIPKISCAATKSNCISDLQVLDSQIQADDNTSRNLHVVNSVEQPSQVSSIQESFNGLSMPLSLASPNGLSTVQQAEGNTSIGQFSPNNFATSFSYNSHDITRERIVDGSKIGKNVHFEPISEQSDKEICSIPSSYYPPWDQTQGSSVYDTDSLEAVGPSSFTHQLFSPISMADSDCTESHRGSAIVERIRRVESDQMLALFLHFIDQLIKIMCGMHRTRIVRKVMRVEDQTELRFLGVIEHVLLKDAVAFDICNQRNNVNGIITITSAFVFRRRPPPEPPPTLQRGSLEDQSNSNCVSEDGQTRRKPQCRVLASLAKIFQRNEMIAIVLPPSRPPPEPPPTAAPAARLLQFSLPLLGSPPVRGNASPPVRGNAHKSQCFSFILLMVSEGDNYISCRP